MSADPSIQTVSTEIAGRTLSIETGLIAEQAHGAVVVRYGDTMVLVTVVGEKEAERRGRTSFRSRSTTKSECTPPARSPADSSSAKVDRPRRRFSPARLTDRPIRPLCSQGLQVRSSGHHYGDVRRSGKRSGHPLDHRRLGSTDALADPVGRTGRRGSGRLCRRRDRHQSDSLADLADSDSRHGGRRHERRHHDGRRRGQTRSPKRRCVARSSAPTQEIRRIVDLQLDLQAPGREREVGRSSHPPKNEDLHRRVEIVLGDRFAPRSTIPTRSCGSRAPRTEAKSCLLT